MSFNDKVSISDDVSISVNKKFLKGVILIKDLLDIGQENEFKENDGVILQYGLKSVFSAEELKKEIEIGRYNYLLYLSNEKVEVPKELRIELENLIEFYIFITVTNC